MSILTRLADNTKPRSVSNRFRRKRFRHFLKMVDDLPKPLKILDIGGTENFWVQMGFTNHQTTEIFILNIDEQKTTCPNIKFIKGDATDLQKYVNREFDVVFSNSVIEHVGSFDEQKKMADEIVRTGKKYFVQTPNKYF